MRQRRSTYWLKTTTLAEVSQQTAMGLYILCNSFRFPLKTHELLHGPRHRLWHGSCIYFCGGECS